jgi:hypothetical protein
MYVYTVQKNNNHHQIVSLLAPEDVDSGGLPSVSILGTLSESNSQDITLDNFVANPDFIDFMHNIVANFAPDSHQLTAEAQQQNHGWIYIIDGRYDSQKEDVSPEDIIGTFEVKEGKILTESYQRNNNHLIFSQNGFFKLEATLETHLLEETRKILN